MRIPAVFTCFLSTLACVPPTPTTPSDIAVPIYRTVLTKAFEVLQTPRRFVLDTTIRLYWRGGSKPLAYLRAAAPTAFVPAVESLIDSDKLPARQLSHDALPSGFDLVHLDPFAHDTRADQWHCFVARLSRIGFDYSRTHAAVYADVICTGFAAGNLFFLQLQNGAWVVTSGINLWMSEG